jgi:hypothetical protein
MWKLINLPLMEFRFYVSSLLILLKGLLDPAILKLYKCKYMHPSEILVKQKHVYPFN